MSSSSQEIGRNCSEFSKKKGATVRKIFKVLFPTSQIYLDLLTGKLELNALLRSGSEDFWESKYGLACCLYTYAVFSVLLIRRALAARLRSEVNNFE